MIVAAVVLGVLVAGVGTTVGVVVHRDHQREEAREKRAADAARQQAAQEQREREAAERRAAEVAQARKTYHGCTQQLTGLIDALDAIHARLDVGINQRDFGDKVGDASVAYDRIDIHALGESWCLSAAAQLEKSFNLYARTNSDWNDCIVDFYCDTDSIEGSMQQRWQRAGRAIERAKTLMAHLDPDDASYDARGPDRAGA